jgi:hypothetical protein
MESTESRSNSKAVGDYIHPIDQIPHEVFTTVKVKAANDHDGRPRLDAKGEPIKVLIVTAKENGSYKGDVLLNGPEWLAQAVGKQRTTIVMHRKADLNLVSERLKQLDESKRMNTTNIQVHYDGTQAKVYPWVRDKEAAKDAPAAAEKKAPLTAKDFASAAQQYADTIKNAKSREAFLKHIEAVSQKLEQGKSADKAAAPKAKAAPSPAKAKEAAQEAALER